MLSILFMSRHVERCWCCKKCDDYGRVISFNVNSKNGNHFERLLSRPFNRPSNWRMCLGKHHMNSSMDVPSAEECYEVDHIVKHEGFVYEQDKSDITNDIALVHLARPVNMSREISPICLPRPGALMPAGTSCFVTGWGDEKGGKLADRIFESQEWMDDVIDVFWLLSF